MAAKDVDGHRARLRARFADGGGRGLADYELLELALTYAIPRKDVKPVAKALMAKFGSLGGVLSAGAGDLAAVDGMGAGSAAFVGVVAQLALRVRREKLADKPLLAGQLELLDYLYTAFAGKSREELHVLYMDGQLRLIADETVFTGTLAQVTASARDILKMALELNAAGLVVAHNHPSGEPMPSGADLAFTVQLVQAAEAMGIRVHDHVIVGAERHYSFRGEGRL